MKVSDYILVTITDSGFGFSGIGNSKQLNHYISSTDYDRSSYEFKHARLVLIYESSLDQETKEKVNKAFQKKLAGE